MKSKKMPVPGHYGYFVTRKGKVFSSIIFGRWQKQMRELTQILNADGYYKVRFQASGKRVNRTVHRLVALTFLPKIRGKNQVRHLDGNKLNNDVYNLAWGTPKENAEDMIRHGRTLKGRKILRSHHGIKNPNSKLTKEQVISIRKEHKPGVTYADLGRKYKVTYVTIRRIVHFDLWNPVLSETIFPKKREAT